MIQIIILAFAGRPNGDLSSSYGVLVGLAVAAVWLLRVWGLAHVNAHARATAFRDVNVDMIACVRDGAHGATTTALAMLMRRGLVEVYTQGFVRAANRALAQKAAWPQLRPLEAMVLEKIKDTHQRQGPHATTCVADLRADLGPAVAEIQTSLQERGLILSSSKRWWVSAFCMAPLFVVTIIGGVLYVANYSRHDLNLSLLLLVLASGFLTYSFRKQGTLAGTRDFLERLRTEYAPLKNSAFSSPETLSPLDIGLVAALFGTNALGGAYADLRDAAPVVQQEDGTYV